VPELAQMKKPSSMGLLPVLVLRLKDSAVQFEEQLFQPPLVKQVMVDHVHPLIVDSHRHSQLLLIANSDPGPSSQPHSSLFLAQLV
jgi:hypothetical protein